MAEYVYLDPKHSGDPFTVGFYDHEGKWQAESDHAKREDAAQRVHFLNGGEDARAQLARQMVRDLPKGATVLSQDKRAISAIYWPQEGDPGHRVGQSGCTAIEAYDENGEMAYVPWIAVFKGDVIVARVPARQVSVHYADPTAEPF